MILNKLNRRLRALLRKPQLERELDDELRFHLDQLIERNLQNGMDADEARYAALKAFGGLDQAKENCRDARRVRVFESLWQDLKYGLRMLIKNPLVSVIAIVTITLGIGATTAVFSVVNTVILRPLPYSADQRLMGQPRCTSQQVSLACDRQQVATVFPCNDS
jgi:putative ABC transport system permease protein